MAPFAEMPIRTKLIRLVVTTCGIVVLLAVVVLSLVEALWMRQSMARSVGTLAQAVAFNSTAALAFDDPADAERVLEALRADRYVSYAALYSADGSLFARYPATHPPEEVPPGLLRPAGGDAFRGGFFHFYQPVMERDIRWGTLYIRYSLTPLRKRLMLDLLVAVCVLAGAIGAAYLIASVIQRSISGPITSLAGVARRISREHDFGLRARKQTEDEVGDLTDAFNEMLNEIAKKEEALRLSEERLRLALGASQTGIWDLNLETGQIMMEGHVFEVFGPGHAQMAFSELVERFIHPDDRGRVESASKAAMEEGTVLDITYRIVTPDNSIRHYYSRGNFRPGVAEKRSHMLGVTIDVTAAREAEEEIVRLNRGLEQRVQERTAELENALHEIESFSYSVSHDLRAPLRSIDGFSKILLADYEAHLDESGKDFLHRIRSSSQKMGQLIEDMLKLSRVTRQEMNRRAVNLSSVAEELIAELERGEPDRVVEVTIEPGLVVFGDENLLRIVLQNLVGNAWKFTARREVARIAVGCKREPEGRVFYVRDNGAGFDMAHADKLFGAFQRLHGIAEFEGTGIGLATVKRIINRHGGRIWAEAAVNEGASFYFTLPDTADDETQAPDPAGRGQSG